ncbi:MAG: class I SAM-dependent methyltransferase [Nannocystis sp.]|nr:class I SAM-dependent methyltransferase [Nannocystis sp.]
MSASPPQIHWVEDGVACSARWRSERGNPPPRRVVVADARIAADAAYRLACEGTAMLWRGDFQSARQLLQALTRRVEAGPRNASAASKPADTSPGAAFHRHRQAQSQRARTLAMLLLPLGDDHGISLRRAPDVRQACAEVYGPAEGPSVVSLRELLGLVGAHEWRTKGVEVPALAGHIHPHYGVFSPTRGEYVELVATARTATMSLATMSMATISLAFDIGTGTGVLAALLARRGVQRVVATDQDARALACARENIARLGLAAQVEVLAADLFPAGRAPLVVCNPPWIPARPGAPIERAIYDPECGMLRGFLAGLADHLTPDGEGWLILSDIAEHLGLRSRAELLAMFAAAGLEVIGRDDVRPQHPRAADPSDPLHAARSAELTSLWRLRAATSVGTLAAPSAATSPERCAC